MTSVSDLYEGGFDAEGNPIEPPFSAPGSSIDEVKAWINEVYSQWASTEKGRAALNYANVIATKAVKQWQTFGTGSGADPTNGSTNFAASTQSVEWNFTGVASFASVDESFRFSLYGPFYSSWSQRYVVIRAGNNNCIDSTRCGPISPPYPLAMQKLYR